MMMVHFFLFKIKWSRFHSGGRASSSDRPSDSDDGEVGLVDTLLERRAHSANGAEGAKEDCGAHFVIVIWGVVGYIKE
jgi:hypothetical protein